MSSPYPEPTLVPLSAGNIVTAAFRIYRDRFKTYLTLGLQASLWGILPYAAFVGLALLSGLFYSINPGLGVLAIAISLGIFIYLVIYCVEKSLRNSAIIARLAFQSLNNQPETPIQSRKLLPTRKNVFFYTKLVASFLIGLANFSGSLIQGLWLGLFAIIGLKNEGTTALIIAIANLISLIIYLWIFARLLVPDVAVALEKLGPINAISRSWNLTEKFSGKIILVISLAFLIGTPIYSIALIPAIIGLAIIISLSSGVAPSAGAIAFGVILFVLTVLLIVIANIFATPFWQILKGVVYFDLKNRKEGLGIGLRSLEDRLVQDKEIGSEPDFESD